MAQQAFDKLEIPRLKLPRGPYTDTEFTEKAAKALAEAATRKEAAEQLGVPPSVVGLAALVHEHGLIPFRSEKEFREKLVKARDKEQQGWAVIGARLGGVSEGRVESLYEETTGIPYTESVLGRGGRPKGEENGAAKPKPKPAKAEPADVADNDTGETEDEVAATVPEFSENPTEEEVGEALNGKTVTVKKGSGTVEVQVAEVAAVKQAKSGRWGAKVNTTDGKERTFPLDQVTAVA